MVPINQVILGGDPLLGNSMVGNSLDELITLLERYKLNLEAARLMKQLMLPTLPILLKLIWNEIDTEISPMTEELKSMLFLNEEYMDIYNRILTLVQEEILALVKPRIESTQEGKELLNNLLKVIKKLKGRIIQETNKEMEMFRKFREFSKTNPDVTYEEFIKSNI